MPSTLIRLAVALLTFGLGVSATMFWIAYRTPEVRSSRFVHHTECGLHHLAPPLPPLPPLDETLPPPPPLAPLSGGILNGKAISKPLPVYPPMAKAYLVSGTVHVQITVDESGRVIAAEAVSGHPLLQEAAVEAAYKARYSPTLNKGMPVKVSGTISYYFAPR